MAEKGRLLVTLPSGIGVNMDLVQQINPQPGGELVVHYMGWTEVLVGQDAEALALAWGSVSLKLKPPLGALEALQRLRAPQLPGLNQGGAE